MKNICEKPLIVIGLATYQRPKMLANALESLKNLAIPSPINVKLVLIDNDAAASAYDIYKKYTESQIFESEYLIEPKRGISNIRNKILNYALEINARYLAFFDDDEQVCKSWLASLYSTITHFHASCVAGRVIYELPDNTENWIINGKFFFDKNLSTGSNLQGASTANALIDLKIVSENNISFHPAFNMSGGGDTHFFKKIHQLNGKIVWCQEAITYESVPESRITETWILKRAYKVGYTTLLRASLNKNGRSLFSFSTKYISLQSILFLYDALLTISKFYNIHENKSLWIKAKRKLYKIRGALNFLMKKDHEEYRVTHGY